MSHSDVCVCVFALKCPLNPIKFFISSKEENSGKILQNYFLRELNFPKDYLIFYESFLWMVEMKTRGSLMKSLLFIHSTFEWEDEQKEENLENNVVLMEWKYFSCSFFAKNILWRKKDFFYLHIFFKVFLFRNC